MPAHDPSDHMNGSGEIIRPTIPKGMIEEFFKPSIKADLNDATDPVKVIDDDSLIKDVIGL